MENICRCVMMCHIRRNFLTPINLFLSLFVVRGMWKRLSYTCKCILFINQLLQLGGVKIKSGSHCNQSTLVFISKRSQLPKKTKSKGQNTTLMD